MRYACVVALVAGCGFAPTVGYDAPTGDGLIDGPDGPPDDVDADGVPNVIDNCPNTANPLQANEDGDDRGDVCDLCPHVVDTNNTDDDGDGIGNTCDPRPAKVDRRVVFLPFNDPAERTQFALRAGSDQWSISGGKLHQTDLALAVPQQIVWTGESIVADVAIQTDAKIDAVPAGTGTRLAAVVGGYDDSGSVDLFACGIRAADAGMTVTSNAWHFIAPPTIDVQAGTNTALTMVAGISGRESLRTTHLAGDDSTLDCKLDAIAVQLAVSNYYAEGYPGFRTLDVTASFDYLFVVAIGVP